MYIDSHDIAGIVAACIGGLAVVVAAILGVLLPILFSIRRHARITREEVTNDHDTNLRVEGDQRHAENAAKLDDLGRLMRAQGRRIGRVDRRVSNLGNRLDVVEDTIPKEPRRKR